MDNLQNDTTSDAKEIDTISPTQGINNIEQRTVSAEVELSEEEKELEEVKAVYRTSPKFELWCELFLDRENKETYGNGTESAMRAYNCKNRPVAGVIANKNIKKVKSLASTYADGRGMTYGKLLDVAMAKMVEDSSPQWWDRIMDMTGHKEIRPTVAIDARTQNNTFVNLNDPEVLKVNKAIKDALMSS